MKSLWGWVGWNGSSVVMGGDETGRPQAGMEIKCEGTGGNGCNFCPRVGL